jgi:hypothetical protein
VSAWAKLFNVSSRRLHVVCISTHRNDLALVSSIREPASVLAPAAGDDKLALQPEQH